MFRQMRRFKQLMPEEDTRRILDEGRTGILGVNGDDGYPYTVPLNYVLIGDIVYIHSAKAGHKVDAMKKDPKVSFTVVCKEDVVAKEFTTYFASAQIFGKARFVEDPEERDKGFRAMGEKYCSEAMEGYIEYMSKDTCNAILIAIDIEQMTGKEAIELTRMR